MQAELRKVEVSNIETVPEEKRWAVGLSQVEFEHEFLRRNPVADAIPRVEKWLGVPIPESRAIDGFKISDDTHETEVPGIPKEEKSKEEVIYCRGCKREFKHKKGNKLARSSHERHCKEFMKVKI